MQTLWGSACGPPHLLLLSFSSLRSFVSPPSFLTSSFYAISPPRPFSVGRVTEKFISKQANAAQIVDSIGCAYAQMEALEQHAGRNSRGTVGSHTLLPISVGSVVSTLSAKTDHAQHAEETALVGPKRKSCVTDKLSTQDSTTLNHFRETPSLAFRASWFDGDTGGWSSGCTSSRWVLPLGKR